MHAPARACAFAFEPAQHTDTRGMLPDAYWCVQVLKAARVLHPRDKCDVSLLPLLYADSADGRADRVDTSEEIPSGSFDTWAATQVC